MENVIKLTQYSHGAGCGCKISPAVLDKILHTSKPIFEDKSLIVGNTERDDAAVYDLGNGTALISTTDFFMPIVDNPYDFGRIAAANAISDVYAMGGTPKLAIAILGWPINKLAPEVAQQVLEGARFICQEANITIAGGHSIDSPEPIFGLAVNGIVNINQLKKNSDADDNSLLYLTKPIGIGILSTAQKKGLLTVDDAQAILNSMTRLNKIGSDIATLEYVSAMTDVTGFGLLGHLNEMCEGSNLNAELYFDKIPTFENVPLYLDKKCLPGGTNRNWQSYGHKVNPLTEYQKNILADPQTSGGLLIAVKSNYKDNFEIFLNNKNQNYHLIGKLTSVNKDSLITVY